MTLISDLNPRKTRILLATQNENKKRELLEILRNEFSPDFISQNEMSLLEFEITPSEVDIEETGSTFQENARIKAQGYWQVLKPDVDYILAEDSGLGIDTLAGFSGLAPFPGVISKRWLNHDLQAKIWGKPLNNPPTQEQLNAAILHLMRNQQNHAARYYCAMCLLDAKTGKVIFEATGEMLLSVANESKGQGGFGYDPIMMPVSKELVLPVTVAELAPGVKNKLSHRNMAFQKTLAFLAKRL